ncbi:hypothetical protein [Candidatus Scalindua japonica]|uniref:hypothetical protein n=1 Tax=Candidatus Scalindua japonica TaxID=1284222 RepID=UPI00105695BF|nr:hypothetical protein [Candidatus Scalindua japonica]
MGKGDSRAHQSNKIKSHGSRRRYGDIREMLRYGDQMGGCGMMEEDEYDGHASLCPSYILPTVCP